MECLKFFLVVIAMVWWHPLLIADDSKTRIEQKLGIILPQHLKQIEENRFQSSRSYDDTKRELIKIFSKVKFIKLLDDEVNLPNVRAIFFHILDQKTKVYAINIYLNVQTGLTEIFFVKSLTPKEP